MNNSFLSGWRYHALVLSVVVAAIAYLCFSLWGGFSDVAAALERISFGGVLFVLAMSLFNYILRFLRWQSYLVALGHWVPWPSSARIYLAGFALTTTPGKAGEALRGILLKPRGVPYTRSLAAFVSERLSDLVAVLLLALLGVGSYHSIDGIMVLGIVGVLSGLFLLSQEAPVRWLASWSQCGIGKWRTLSAHLAQMLQETRRCHAPGLLVKAMFLSVAAWGAEALAFCYILHLMGANTSIAFGVFVYAVAVLAGALSFLPGGLGGTEAVMIGLLLWQGIGRPEAIAATVLIRLSTLWFAVLIGVFALAISKPRQDDAVV